MILEFDKGASKDKANEAIPGKALHCGFSFRNAVTFLKQMHRKYFQQVVIDIKAGEVIQTKSFKSMVNLMLLQINNWRLEGKFKSFPPKLKWLQWHGCSLKCMPSDFWPRELAILDLTHSHIENLWHRKGCKVFQSSCSTIIACDWIVVVVNFHSLTSFDF